MALTSGGVYVIDAKRYKNAKVRVRRSGGLLSPAREQLMVKWARPIQAFGLGRAPGGAVRVALSTFHHAGVTASDIPVVSVLCFDDADLPIFGTPRIGGVPLLGPKAPPSFFMRRPDPSMRAHWLPSIDTSLRPCRWPEGAWWMSVSVGLRCADRSA